MASLNAERMPPRLERRQPRAVVHARRPPLRGASPACRRRVRAAAPPSPHRLGDQVDRARGRQPARTAASTWASTSSASTQGRPRTAHRPRHQPLWPSTTLPRRPNPLFDLLVRGRRRPVPRCRRTRARHGGPRPSVFGSRRNTGTPGYALRTSACDVRASSDTTAFVAPAASRPPRRAGPACGRGSRDRHARRAPCCSGRPHRRARPAVPRHGPEPESVHSTGSPQPRASARAMFPAAMNPTAWAPDVISGLVEEYPSRSGGRAPPRRPRRSAG